VNIPLLWMSAEERGFTSDRWLTYQQAKAVGGQIRREKPARRPSFTNRLKNRRQI
jgi:antirestriction protein ArdC